MTCIPRIDMPQIDMADMSALENFLWQEYGLSCVDCYIPTGLIQHKQCPDHFDPEQYKRNTQGLENKPILLSLDKFILDGNHHHCAAKIDGRVFCSCVVIGADFDTSVNALRHFAKVHYEGEVA